MTDFEFDCKEKKHIASNAKRMKNGSKSRKCSLSTDHMTHAQWKKKNGEVKIMNMNQPITFAQLKAMPTDLQKEYIDKMIERFGCNMSALANFFGLNAKEIKKLFVDLRIDSSRFRRGLRMSAEQVADFNQWRDQAIAKIVPKEIQKPVVEPDIPAETNQQALTFTMELKTKQETAMRMNKMSATFEGQLNVAQIQKFLAYATDGKPAYIKITVGAMEDNG